MYEICKIIDLLRKICTYINGWLNKLFFPPSKVDLNIFLMPEVDRVYPGTIEAFLISTYTFACTANSTDGIKSITWEINGVPVADGIKTRNESRGQLHQLTSEMTYNPAITDTKISCVVQGINETKEETVFIKCKIRNVCIYMQGLWTCKKNWRFNHIQQSIDQPFNRLINQWYDQPINPFMYQSINL